MNDAEVRADDVRTFPDDQRIGAGDDVRSLVG